MQPTDLQRSPQAFGGSLVPTVARATHRAAHGVFGQHLPEVRTAGVAAAVGVEDHARLGPAPEPSHAQRSDVSTHGACAASLDSPPPGG